MKKSNAFNKASELTNILNDAMVNLKNAVDINTVVGKPIKIEDGSVIVPVSKVYVGIVSGGGELNKKQSNNNPNYPFAGGTGAGFTISPIGFLVTKENITTFVATETNKSDSKLTELATNVFNTIIDNLKKEKI